MHVSVCVHTDRDTVYNFNHEIALTGSLEVPGKTKIVFSLPFFGFYKENGEKMIL